MEAINFWTTPLIKYDHHTHRANKSQPRAEIIYYNNPRLPNTHTHSSDLYIYAHTYNINSKVYINPNENSIILRHPENPDRNFFISSFLKIPKPQSNTSAVWVLLKFNQRDCPTHNYIRDPPLTLPNTKNKKLFAQFYSFENKQTKIHGFQNGEHFF